MTIVKYCLCLIFTILTFSICLRSQERDSLIQLYPGMGDTLDLIDRDIFGLYPDIEGFQHAQIFSRDNKFIISKIRYNKNGLTTDTIVVEDFFKYSAMLSKFIIENTKKIESPLETSIFTKRGANYNGKLEMFSKRFIYFYSDMNYSSRKQSTFHYKTDIKNIDSLMIPKVKNLFPYIGGGAFAGFFAGFFIGKATFEDDMGADKEVKWMISGGIGALIGGLLGWLIGEEMQNDYITIQFNTPFDVTKLKEYSAYYYQGNLSIEKQYIEID